MIEVAFSSSFKRSFKKRIKGKASEDKFWERLDLFIHNPFDVKLKTHKLSGKYKELWSFSIEYDIRIIFFFKSNTKVVFINIGSHNEVY